MGIRRTTTTPPPAHPKTKRGRTRHEGTQFRFPLSADEVAALAHEIDESTVEAFLSRAEDWARDALAAAGLPVHLGPVRRDADGRWFDDLPKDWREKKPADVLKPGETVATLLGLVKDRPHSLEWHTARVLRFAGETRRQMQSKDALATAWNTIHLVQARHLAGFKLDLEWPLDVGIRVIEAGTHGKRTSREDVHLAWKAAFDKIARQNPDKAKAEVYRMVAERFETSPEAVKKALQRLKRRADK